MELTGGYKQTELGVIPEDWVVKQLGDISKIIMGHSPSSSYYNTNNLGVPLIQGNADIKNRKAIKRIFTSYVTKLAKAESILMSVRAPVGTIAKTTFDACIGRGICAINFENNWIYHYLIHIEPNWYKHSQGSTFESINSSDILSLNINYPPTKTEQTAIAKVLTDVDDLLESLDKLIAKKRDIKQATMQQLLTGKTRLPSFANNQGYKQTELGVIPEDWDLSTIQEQAYFVKSGATNTNNLGMYLLYGSTGKIGTCCNPEYTGDALLIARVGANAGSLYQVKGKYGVSDNTIILKINNKNNIKFFNYLLQKQNLNSIIFGSGQPLITGTQIKNICVLRPTKTEQTAIAKVLTEIDDEIEALEQRRNKLTNLKQGMMQQLLTGKIRLIKPQQHKE